MIWKNLTSKETFELLNQNPDLIILDIRTKPEFEDFKIKNSINIDYYQDDFIEKLNELDKEKTYILYCRTGGRTSSSKSIFERLKFNEIIHLKHGIMDWINNNFKIVK